MKRNVNNGLVESGPAKWKKLRATLVSLSHQNSKRRKTSVDTPILSCQPWIIFFLLVLGWKVLVVSNRFMDFG